MADGSGGAGGASPDRVAAVDALRELCALAPQRQWRLILVDSTLDDVDTFNTQYAPCTRALSGTQLIVRTNHEFSM